MKPHPNALVTFPDFVRVRQNVSWITLGIALLAIFTNLPEPLVSLAFLTNWMRYTVAGAYFLIWLGHAFNGDINQAEYVAPDVTKADLVNCLSLWKWGTLLYEFQLIASTFVFIVFFVVEFPIQMYEFVDNPTKFSYSKYPAGVFLFGLLYQTFTHAVPFFVAFKEFLNSSIKLRWKHIIYHYFLISCYFVVNYTYSFATDSLIYVSIDFRTNPAISLVLAVMAAGPVWFGITYLFMLLQDNKESKTKI